MLPTEHMKSSDDQRKSFFINCDFLLQHLKIVIITLKCVNSKKSHVERLLSLGEENLYTCCTLFPSHGFVLLDFLGKVLMRQLLHIAWEQCAFLSFISYCPNVLSSRVFRKTCSSYCWYSNENDMILWILNLILCIQIGFIHRKVELSI